MDVTWLEDEANYQKKFRNRLIIIIKPFIVLIKPAPLNECLRKLWEYDSSYSYFIWRELKNFTWNHEIRVLIMRICEIEPYLWLRFSEGLGNSNVLLLLIVIHYASCDWTSRHRRFADSSRHDQSHSISSQVSMINFVNCRIYTWFSKWHNQLYVCKCIILV